MWLAMMAGMMLPSLVPMLWRYRASVDRVGEFRLARLTALVAAGYFGVWLVPGIAAWLTGNSLAAPVASGLALVIAGLHQFSAWKLRHLACCRAAPAHALAADAATAWRHGLRLGLHCIASCGGLMLILPAAGMMDMGAMASVTAAITLERLAPAGWRAADAVGAVAVIAGFVLLARAAGIA